ncbi:2OG-Fe(II) oxygenase [Aliiglaciecola sp. 3_MG-2023]|uniref:prolyl hydroxylase family protein n=1 Tax=Aliiglaciecola sp. 3_MG-2023 TaxID=3062644 RepID=UPI0026E48287|nr:2OG-Fe(II) oxygenase [Aliiglaciecola sp. 3_MG-2023]MDO6692899.1 2OG-Fe(II) oxygenase [Aliiglaciecola sp. 3_MG-2023]
MSSLPQNWKSWVLQNLLQGTDSIEILKILLQNGFTFEAAKNALGNNLPAGTGCNKDESFYAKVSQPKLLQNLAQYNGKLIDDPRVQMVQINNFLSEQECDALIALTKTKLRPSEIPEREGDAYQKFRTSSTCDLPFTKDPLAQEIDEKIIDTLGLGFGEKEVIQAQHYAVGQEFKAHCDYFLPGTNDFKIYSKNGGQRTWTFMVYLNEDCEGGETEFIKLGRKFKPTRGMALVWNNLLPNGSINTDTLHHAHPITRGEKVVITKWFREDVFVTKGKKPRKSTNQ